MIGFRKKGWFYTPINLVGWVITLVALATNTWFFMMIDRNSHSASDTLISFLPYFTSVWVGYNWFASNTSSTKN